MQLYIRLEAPYEWVRVDGRRVEAFGEVGAIDEYPEAGDYEMIGVVPGEWVTVHSVTLPAKSRKQFMTALPYTLEETVSEDVENLHFVCPEWRAGEPCTVLVVAQDKMAEWQNLANEHFLPVSRLLPDHALVPVHDAAEYTLAGTEDRILSNGKLGEGVCLDPELLESWIMDVPVSATIAVSDSSMTEQLIESHPERDFRHWPVGSKLAHWLEYPNGAKFDLWNDKFRPSVSNLNWRSFAMPALLLALALGSVMLYDTWRYFSLHQEVKAIDREMQEIILQAFPEIDNVEVNNELFIMQQAMARRNNPALAPGLHTLMADTAAVLRRQNVTLSNMVFRDDELVITCELSDFSQVDAINRQLNSRPSINASLQSSASDDGRISASYALRHG